MIAAVFDAANLCSGANRDVLALLDNRQKDRRGLRLRADHATRAHAEPAIGATGPRYAVRIRIGFAERGGRSWVRMIAKRACSVLEQGGKVWNFGRRYRVLSAPPAFEDVTTLNPLPSDVACFARNADQLLGARIVRFQFVVGDAPILN